MVLLRMSPVARSTCGEICAVEMQAIRFETLLLKLNIVWLQTEKSVKLYTFTFYNWKYLKTAKPIKLRTTACVWAILLTLLRGCELASLRVIFY